MCLEAGMDDYVAKPIRLNKLMMLLDDVILGSRSAARAATLGPRGTGATQMRIRGPRPVPRAATNGQADTRTVESFVDPPRLLDYLDGDEELLKDIIAIFLEDCPALVTAIWKPPWPRAIWMRHGARPIR